MDRDQCRNVFQLGRPECRPCAGRDKNCPNFRPWQERAESEKIRGKEDGDERLEDA